MIHSIYASAISEMCGALGLVQQALDAAFNSMASDAVVQKGHCPYGQTIYCCAEGTLPLWETVDCTSGALKGSVCISKLILEVSVPVGLKQLPRSINFTPTLPLSTHNSTLWHTHTQRGSIPTASVLECKQAYVT